MPKKRILIIDDDEGIQSLLKEGLEWRGFECVCADSVEMALDCLTSFKPNLILLDLLFQRTNGTAFLQGLKRRFEPGKKRPPVLVISGCEEQEVIDYVLDMGAAGFIKKPFDQENLLSLVSEHII